MTGIEFLGYLSSAVLLISFLFSDSKKLRVVNSIGCLLFIVYGYLINSPPVMITNISIVMINAYHLFWRRSTH